MPLLLPQRGLLRISHPRLYICYLFLLELSTVASKNPRAQHIGIRAFQELEKLKRNAIKGMHAYQRFAVMSTEKQKRVYEKSYRN